MATFHCEFASSSLARQARFELVLPNDVPEEFVKKGNSNYDRPMGLLIVLHGYTASSTEWLQNSRIAMWAGKYNLAVALPNCENSFYLNRPSTGFKYADYVGKELPEYVRSTFGITGDNYIGGESMGGFGALHTAFMFPENFRKAFAFSSALIHREVAGMKEGSGNPVANYEYYREMFGEPAELLESENSPEWLYTDRKAAGRKLPPVFMACGTEDFLYANNLAMKAFLEEQGADFEFHEGPGVHNFDFWDAWLEPAVEWMVKA